MECLLVSIDSKPTENGFLIIKKINFYENGKQYSIEDYWKQKKNGENNVKVETLAKIKLVGNDWMGDLKC